MPTESVAITSWFTASGEQKVLMSPPTLTETVRRITLAEILAAGKMERCDLMKMDIVGAEFPIFEATPPKVWGGIDRIVMETHEDAGGRSQELLVDTLKKQGFYVKTHPMFLYAIRPALITEL